MGIVKKILAALGAAAAIVLVAAVVLPVVAPKLVAPAPIATAPGVNQQAAALVAVEETPPVVRAPASACDAVREALLTGTQADVILAMRYLMGDTAAPSSAREYADNYVNRDRRSASGREMDVLVIRSAC